MAPASFCFHLSIVRHEQLTTIDFQVTVYLKAVVEDTRSIYDIDRQCAMLLYGQWRATRYMYKVYYLNVACIHIYVSGVLIFACISSILVLHYSSSTLASLPPSRRAHPASQPQFLVVKLSYRSDFWIYSHCGQSMQKVASRFHEEIPS